MADEFFYGKSTNALRNGEVDVDYWLKASIFAIGRSTLHVVSFLVQF